MRLNQRILRNVFSKISLRILRVLLYHATKTNGTTVSTNSIFISSTINPPIMMPGDVFLFGRHCHINHSCLKTGTDNDVSICFAVPFTCAKAFWQFFFRNCTRRLDYVPSEIARGGWICSTFTLDCIAFGRLQVRWSCLEIRFFRLDSRECRELSNPEFETTAWIVCIDSDLENPDFSYESFFATGTTDRTIKRTF